MHAVIQNRCVNICGKGAIILVALLHSLGAVSSPAVTPTNDSGNALQGVRLLSIEPAGRSTQSRPDPLLAKRLCEIEKGADINFANCRGQTALMCAAASNDFLATCWLVAKGADVALINEHRQQARDYATDVRIRKLLRFAAEATSAPGNLADIPFPVRSAEYLALRVRRTVPASGEALPVQMTADMAGEELILALALRLPPGVFPPAQQLACALLQEDMPAISSLLRDHPQLLHDHDLIRYARSADAVRTLMNVGMNPGVTWCISGRTGQDTLSLLVPALHSNVHVVHALLQAGCPLPVYADGRNILHTLASLPHSAALADELVSAGADPNQVTHTTNETPLSTALRHRNLGMAAALLRLGARVDDTCAAALFESSEQSPANPQYIPALIALLHANGWTADDHIWRLFLSEYLAAPRISPDLPQSMEPRCSRPHCSHAFGHGQPTSHPRHSKAPCRRRRRQRTGSPGLLRYHAPDDLLR